MANDNVPASGEGAYTSGGEAIVPTGKAERKGMKWDRLFSRDGQDSFHTNYRDGSNLEYELRTATFHRGEDEHKVEQKDVEVPSSWSVNATNVLAGKYFYGDVDKPQERERSLKQVVGRVAKFIAQRGQEMGYFATQADADGFKDDIQVLMVNQVGCFNSPTLFNAGVFHEYGVRSGSEGHYRWDSKLEQVVKMERGQCYEFPQPSACFILGVEDSMDSIMEVATHQAMLFKGGSGSGIDLSTLRSSYEKLEGGGNPSGPMSFIKIYDTIGGVVKSGGKTRRAAEMLSLQVAHPNIMDFIGAKKRQEELAHILIDNGVDGSIGGEAYSTVSLQNANLSVRATDEFMRAVEEKKDWQTLPVHTKDLSEIMPHWPAEDMMRAIAEGAHFCGDPGVQYHTTINKWNTCKTSGEIMASNPCSEYMFLNDSACNLASINLMKFRLSDGKIDYEMMRKAGKVFIIAQDILVDAGSYPSPKIASTSHEFRPLGLGYGNLGALVMSLGMPYDSDEARATNSAVTAFLTAEAYKTSIELAKHRGTFKHFDKNKSSMLEVMVMHKDAVENIDETRLGPNKELKRVAQESWKEVVSGGETGGYANAQVTVLAPTGTIGFFMDCDTTGIEPDLALVKYKQLAGGGGMKIINQTVPMALNTLGYTPEEVEPILVHMQKTGTIEGAPGLKSEHLAVFDCAFKPDSGVRSISYMGHLRMMAAAQPYISGAISKTVNIPEETSVGDISEMYMGAWKMGLKAVAIYRNNSKRTQPMNTTEQGGKGLEDKLIGVQGVVGKPFRRKLPQTVSTLRHKFDVAGHEGYIHVGLYEDGTPGELFINMSKEGSTIGGIMDAFATSISLNLQYGVPLEDLVSKFRYQKFDPQGFVNTPKNRGSLEEGFEPIRTASSIVDYVFAWMEQHWVEGKKNGRNHHEDVSSVHDNVAGNGGAHQEDPNSISGPGDSKPKPVDGAMGICPDCGGVLVKFGKCDKRCTGTCKKPFVGDCGGG
ncbi:MAG: vitamin B12-dependent ribonucleotide reductase [archaeon]